MAIIKALQPAGPTVLVAGTTASQSVTVPGNGATLRVFNASASVARIEFGGAAATTPIVGTNGSMGVPAGAVETFDMGALATKVAVLLDTGTGNVELTRGEGM